MMRVDHATPFEGHRATETSRVLVHQGSILAEKVKRSGAVLEGLDGESYAMCLQGTPTTMDIQRIRDLLDRIGR